MKMSQKIALAIAGISLLALPVIGNWRGWQIGILGTLLGFAVAAVVLWFGPIKKLPGKLRKFINSKGIGTGVIITSLFLVALELFTISYRLNYNWWFLSPLIVPATLLWLYLGLRILASRDKFFTDKVKQGRIHFVMVGGVVKTCLANLREQGKWVNPKTGEVWVVEFSPDGEIIKGRKLDVEYWMHLKDPLPPIKKTDRIWNLMNSHNWLLQLLQVHFGWYFMSWNPDAKLWEGKFSRFQAKGEREGTPSTDADIKLVYREESTNALFPSGTYGIDTNVVTGVARDETGTPIKPATGEEHAPETSENVPVKLQFAAEIAVTNALTAQFREPSNPYFLTALMKSVESSARGIVSGMTYDTLTTATTEGEHSPWFNIVNELNGDQAGGNPSMITKNGVMLVAIHLIGQKITDAEIEKTVTKRNAAKRERQAAIEAAEGARKVTLLNNEASADTIEKVEKARQELAIKLMEARKTNDPNGKFATAEALKEWKQMRYANFGGGNGPVPFLNVDLESDKKEGKPEPTPTGTGGTV